MEAVNVNETQAADVTKIAKEGYTLELESFSRGDSKGFQFYKKQYNSSEDAVKHIMVLKKCSHEEADAIVTALLNQSISNAMRAKATSKLPADESETPSAEVTKRLREEAISKGNIVLVSEVDAESYVPGTREKTSIPSLWKEYNLTKDAAIKAKAAGNMEDYEAYKTEALEIKAKITALMSENELDNL